MTVRSLDKWVRWPRRSASTRLWLTITLMACGCLLWTRSGAAGLAGSKHDFTKAEWSGGNACLPCHVPHRADQPKSPKWGGPATIRTDPPGDRGRPGRLSRICLNCHDGGTAPDTFGDEPTVPTMSARARVAAHGDLRGNHPVGVRYPIGERSFHPPSALERTGGVRLFQGRVECSSCHDPHNNANQPYLLVMSNDESQLCFSCHRK